MPVNEHRLEMIATFGYLWYYRKKGVWCFAPFAKHKKDFSKEQFQHVDLNLLVDNAMRDMTKEKV
ncbi:MAG TPA: hypothetical protein VD794_03830 [Flavisolibacter sp.]|nr:hypothetical protein [Flavisolibacter sp.]